MHNLKVNVNNKNFEGAFGLSINKFNIFLVAKIDEIFIYDIDTYEEKSKVAIELLKTTAREPNEVIGMSKSKCEQWLAVISGKNLIMNQ